MDSSYSRYRPSDRLVLRISASSAAIRERIVPSRCIWRVKKEPYHGPSVAVFQYDHESWALKDPCILPVRTSLVLKASSGLWERSMMRRGDQFPPLVSICLAENNAGGHTILFPDGAGSLFVIVDNQLVTTTSAGHQLKGGELVRVYCKSWFIRRQWPVSHVLHRTASGRDRRDKLLGPLIFQYRADGQDEDMRSDLDGESPQGEELPRVYLDQLPPEVQRTIFSFLPADEVLRNIPAVCSKFLQAARSKQPSSRWEITQNFLAPQEMVFLQGWTSRPVSHLTLRLREAHLSCIKEYLLRGADLRLSRESVKSIEIDTRAANLLDGSRADWEKHHGSFLISAVGRSPSLKCFKLHGVPIDSIGTIIPEHLLRALERLWISFTRKDAPTSPPIRILTVFTSVPKELKVVVFRFELASKMVSVPLSLAERRRNSRIARGAAGKRHPRTQPAAETIVEVPPEPPCDIEELFSCFCPAEASNRQRVLILNAEGKAWKTCIDMISKLKTLHALWISISTKEFLGLSEVKRLVNCLPASLQVLRVTPKKNDELFNDELCLALAVQCPDFEIFVCHESGRITQKGVRTLTIGCENLKRLALLHWENELQVLREDVLPKKLQKGVRLYEDELRRVFE